MPFKARPHFWKYPITEHGLNDASDQKRQSRLRLACIRLGICGLSSEYLGPCVADLSAGRERFMQPMIAASRAGVEHFFDTFAQSRLERDLVRHAGRGALRDDVQSGKPQRGVARRGARPDRVAAARGWCWPNAGLCRRGGVLGQVRAVDREVTQAAAAMRG